MSPDELDPQTPPEAIEPPDGAVSPSASASPPLVSRRAVGAWLVLAGALIALDGPVGGAVAVIVAAVLLARLAPRVLGALGVVALAAAPMVVIAQGVPSAAEVSPRFVLRSLVPHHLTFAGLVLVSVWVVIDLRPHLAGVAPVASPAAGEDGDAPLRSISLPFALALVGIVAVGALVASLAVLQA